MSVSYTIESRYIELRTVYRSLAYIVPHASHDDSSPAFSSFLKFLVIFSILHKPAITTTGRCGWCVAYPDHKFWVNNRVKHRYNLLYCCTEKLLV